MSLVVGGGGRVEYYWLMECTNGDGEREGDWLDICGMFFTFSWVNVIDIS